MMFRMARKQALIGVCYDGVCRVPEHQRPPQDVMETWSRLTEKIAAIYRLHLYRTEQLVPILEQNGLRGCILKGTALSRLYPVPERRMCGDIDIWVAGYLGLKKARVRYFLSINADCLPENAVQGEKRTYRTLSIDGSEFEFSQGFTELHTESYRQILAGNGFRIGEARPCIEIVSQIRNATPVGLVGDYHPLAKLPLSHHPFGWDDRR